MGSVEKLAEEVSRGLQEALPGRRKTLLRKLPLAVAAMLEARTANTVWPSSLLPLEVERQDRHEQWWRQLLAQRLIVSHEVRAPFARQVLSRSQGTDGVVEPGPNGPRGALGGVGGQCADGGAGFAAALGGGGWGSKPRVCGAIGLAGGRGGRDAVGRPFLAFSSVVPRAG